MPRGTPKQDYAGLEYQNVIQTPPLVSVVMPVLNPHPVYFPHAVGSILWQTLKEFELIVVEDPGFCSAEGMLAQLDDPRIRYCRNARRTSLVDQRNRGLTESRAEFVAMLDADDIAEPERLRKQIDYLATHQDIAVLGSHIRIIEARGLDQGYRRYPLDHDAIVSAMRRFNAISQPSVMFRKRAVAEAGGYQYRKYPAVEDYELWCRLALRGLRFANYPEPLIRYRIHSKQLKITELRQIIRGTLEIKSMYWHDSTDAWGKARVWSERLLLWLPPRLVLSLFMRTHYTNQLSPGRIGSSVPDTERVTAEQAGWKLHDHSPTRCGRGMHDLRATAHGSSAKPTQQEA
jgi:glycosyltransferase involved in cell wall biosynthesis